MRGGLVRKKGYFFKRIEGKKKGYVMFLGVCFCYFDLGVIVIFFFC